MRPSKQNGSSLLYVILFLGFMFVIAFSLSALSVQELQTTAVNQASQQAFYAAEAGIERGIFEVVSDPAITSGEFEDDNLYGETVSEEGYQAFVGGSVAAASTQDNLEFTLQGNLDLHEISLFDPENLGLNVFGSATSVGVTVECIDDCGASFGGVAPGLEATVISFDPATVGGFDVTALLDDDAAPDARTTPDTLSLDESDIGFQKVFIDPLPTIGSIDVGPMNTLNNLDDIRYLLQFKALRAGATYRVSFNQDFSVPGSLVVQSFGTVSGNRRALQVTLDQNTRLKNIFDFVLFEETGIQKEAR